MNICNIPQDVLVHQVRIETIPDITLLILLCVTTVLAYKFYNSWKSALTLPYHLGVVGVLLLIFITCWIQASHLLVRVVTSLSNPEYAAMLHFAQGCVK
jgi:hypothetical protein